MTDLIVHPQVAPLVGSVPVPSDKSIAHRALMVSAIAHGRSHLRRFAGGEDHASTTRALRAMGVRIEESGADRELIVHGVGLFGLTAPKAPLDCGNSGTTMRLLSGLLAPQPFAVTLIGDASLMRRPMMRIVEPLSLRGAPIAGAPSEAKRYVGRDGRAVADCTAPLGLAGLAEGTFLGALEYVLPVASAQVKSALLLSGLYAHGTTHLSEPSLSRDHTERLLLHLGVPLRTVGPHVELDPAGWDGQLPAFEAEIPGDLSAAAFLIVAAQGVPGSNVVVRQVGINRTRTGLLEVARDMGAAIRVDPVGDALGEPIGDLYATAAELRGARVGGELVARAIDEIPILCALAARAHGQTTITDAAELRVKESDRIAAMISVLRAFGVECDERADGMQMEGRVGPFLAAEIDSRGDHRIAMAAAVLALTAAGPSRIRDVDCIATSFPRFVGTLRALGAKIDVEHA